MKVDFDEIEFRLAKMRTMRRGLAKAARTDRVGRVVADYRELAKIGDELFGAADDLVKRVGALERGEVADSTGDDAIDACRAHLAKLPAAERAAALRKIAM